MGARERSVPDPPFSCLNYSLIVRHHGVNDLLHPQVTVCLYRSIQAGVNLHVQLLEAGICAIQDSERKLSLDGGAWVEAEVGALSLQNILLESFLDWRAITAIVGLVS